MNQSDGEVMRFQNFLNIKSISQEGPKGSYQECVDFLIKMAGEFGFTKGGETFYYNVIEPVKDKPILVFTWKGTDPLLPSIVLNSHYDVVPADEKKWDFDPFQSVKTENGNIYGRGTQDMKCVCMQYMEAIGRLINKVKQGSLEAPLRTIHLSYLPDEEIGGRDGALKFRDTELFQSMNTGMSLDEGLANPSDKFTVFYGEKSCWWVKIISSGPVGHGSQFIKDTAVEKLTFFLTEAYKYRAQQEALLKNEPGCKHCNAKKLGDVTTLNVTALQAGVEGALEGYGINCIPPSAVACMDLRIPPTLPMDEMEALLKEWTNKEGLSYEFYQKTPKHSVTSIEDTNPWWVTFKKTMKELGKELDVEIFPAATDSRYFRQIGIPCFGFSPMSDTPILLHDHNEFINERVFMEGINVYEKLIMCLANEPEHEQL
jgi:aminoacylase